MKKISLFFQKMSVKNRRILGIVVSILIVIIASIVIFFPKEDKVELGDIKGEDGEVIEKTDGNNAEEISGTDSLGNNYFTRYLPAWRVSADIPEGWKSSVDQKNGVVYFKSTNKDYSGIEIAIKHLYCPSNVPVLLRKNFDYYFLYDFKYHADNGVEYVTTDYEPQEINLIKDDSITVWVDKEAESYPGTDERGDPNSYYMEYPTEQDVRDAREDKKLIAVQENPRLTLKQEKTHNMFENFYSTAYYFGYAESDESIVLTVSGPQSKSLEINEIAKNVAYSVNDELPKSALSETAPTQEKTTFCGENLNMPKINNNGFLSDDYTSPLFFTTILNTTVKNDTGHSFEEFYQTNKISEVIQKHYYGNIFEYDDNTKSGTMGGGVIKETTFAGHKAMSVFVFSETRTNKESVKQNIRSKGVSNYSEIMLVDLGDNNIAIFAVTAPDTAVATSVSNTFKSIFPN